MVLSTNEFQSEDPKLSIFPNPSSDYIFISGNHTKAHYVVRNILGRSILNEHTSDDSKIDISGLEAGIYFIQFKN